MKNASALFRSYVTVSRDSQDSGRYDSDVEASLICMQLSLQKGVSRVTGPGNGVPEKNHVALKGFNILVIRIIHTLGGCGGTLLSRCIGVLPGVAFLSEVNPASVNLLPAFNPIFQGTEWLGLLTKTDTERFSGRDLGEIENFRELVQVFYDRAQVNGRQLVLRDYNYIEFIGRPFRPDPPRRMLLHTGLPQAIPTASVALIRHPVDQWLSLCKHLQPESRVNPKEFCDAYADFLRELGEIAVFKYEDFVESPDKQLRAICSHLSLQFVPSFKEHFYRYDNVTGDLTRQRDCSISPPAKKPIPDGLMEEFRSSDNFRSILLRTGYSN